MNRFFAQILLLLFFMSAAEDICAMQKNSRPAMVSAVSVIQKLRDNNRFFLVDVRDEKAYAEFKIPGSINLPLAFIRTRSFLKTKPVVLVDAGFPDSRILADVEKLNQNGFEIRIMKGGLLAWHHKKGPLVGDPFAPKRLNRISARQFFSERNHSGLHLFNACKSEKINIKGIFPGVVSLPPEDQKAMASALSFLKQKPMHWAVIFDESGFSYDHLEKKIPQALYHKVFYLDGGIHSYQTFLHNLKLANRPKSSRLKETGQCEPCKKPEIN